jgi:hypothetical protein
MKNGVKWCPTHWVNWVTQQINQSIPTPHNESPDLAAPCSSAAMSATDLPPERMGACASSSLARPLMDVAQI